MQEKHATLRAGSSFVNKIVPGKGQSFSMKRIFRSTESFSIQKRMTRRVVTVRFCLASFLPLRFSMKIDKICICGTDHCNYSALKKSEHMQDIIKMIRFTGKEFYGS